MFKEMITSHRKYCSFSGDNMFESHCTLCLESITDPICTHCYIKQTRIWFNDIKINPIIKDFVIKKIKNRLLFETINEPECILCKNENVDVCFYCFGFIAIQIFKELNLTDEMIENFSEFFNYELMGRELKIDQVEDPSKLEEEYYEFKENLNEENQSEHLDNWTAEFDL